MKINFYPNREQMIKEIKQCEAADRLEVLLSFCTCCVYNIFEKSTLVSECLKCGIRKGINTISDRRKPADVPDIEFLGVC